MKLTEHCESFCIKYKLLRIKSILANNSSAYLGGGGALQVFVSYKYFRFNLFVKNMNLIMVVSTK